MASVGNEKSYETKKDEHIPVQDDEAAVEEGVDEVTANSDAQLGRFTFHTFATAESCS